MVQPRHKCLAVKYCENGWGEDLFICHILRHNDEII